MMGTLVLLTGTMNIKLQYRVNMAARTDYSRCRLGRMYSTISEMIDSMVNRTPYMFPFGRPSPPIYPTFRSPLVVTSELAKAIELTRTLRLVATSIMTLGAFLPARTLPRVMSVVVLLFMAPNMEISRGTLATPIPPVEMILVMVLTRTLMISIIMVITPMKFPVKSMTNVTSMVMITLNVETRPFPWVAPGEPTKRRLIINRMVENRQMN